MLLLYDYDIFWAFLIISSVIPIFAFIISRVLAPISKRPEKLSSYELGIEPDYELGDAWLQFRICHYLFALVFIVFDVEIVFLYPWAMNFDVLGVSIFRSFNFCAYPNCWYNLCCWCVLYILYNNG